MLAMLLILCGLYISYITAVKHSLRFYMFKRPLYDLVAYAASLTFGGIVSIACCIPVILAFGTAFAAWQLAFIPTCLAIGIGEILYYRNQKWTEKFVNRQWKTLERQSRIKRL